MTALVARETVREIRTIPGETRGCMSCIVWPMMTQATHGPSGGGDYGQRLREDAIAACLDLRQDGACAARAVTL